MVRSINITWVEWAANITAGGPIEGYMVQWRDESNVEWTSVWLNGTGNLFYTVQGLKPYTVYEASVTAFKFGSEKLGQLSPVTRMRTKCAG